jgi:nucleoside-triphosphatase THEP1
MPVPELDTFLQTIWGDTEGVVRLATRSKELRFRTTLYQWPEHKNHILRFIEDNEAAKNEVYFSPDMFKPEAMTERHATRDLVMGSRVICLDFDGNAPDISAWDETGTHEGMPVPSVVVQSSKADNQHMYWVLDTFITDIKLLEDMRRAITYRLKADGSGWDAGQLLRPPYTTNYGYVKKRKETYEVFVQEMSDRIYSANSFTPPRDFVPLITEAIDPSALPSVVSVLANGNFVHGFTELFSKTLEEGKRSDALVAIAYYAAESNLSDAEIYALVFDADTRWGKYVGRTDRHKRISNIVERARAKYPTGLGEITFNFGDEAEVAPKSVYTFEELLSLEQNIEWLIPGKLSTTGYGIFGGPPGVGKTQVAIRLGVAITRGEPFMGWIPDKVGEPGNVLMFSLEMNTLGIKHFLSQMEDLQEPSIFEQIKDRFRIYPMAEELDLNHKLSREVFQRIIQENSPRLVIIDSLSRAVKVSLSNEEAVRELGAYLERLRRIYKCAIVVIHHGKKKQALDKAKNFAPSTDDLLGSQYISTHTDFVLMFNRVADGLIAVDTVKMRYSATQDTFYLRRDENLNFERVTEEPTPNMKMTDPLNYYKFLEQMKDFDAPTNDGPTGEPGTEPPKPDSPEF